MRSDQGSVPVTTCMVSSKAIVTAPCLGWGWRNETDASHILNPLLSPPSATPWSFLGWLQWPQAGVTQWIVLCSREWSHHSRQAHSSYSAPSPDCVPSWTDLFQATAVSMTRRDWKSCDRAKSTPPLLSQWWQSWHLWVGVMSVWSRCGIALQSTDLLHLSAPGHVGTMGPGGWRGTPLHTSMWITVSSRTTHSAATWLVKCNNLVPQSLLRRQSKICSLDRTRGGRHEHLGQMGSSRLQRPCCTGGLPAPLTYSFLKHQSDIPWEIQPHRRKGQTVNPEQDTSRHSVNGFIWAKGRQMERWGGTYSRGLHLSTCPSLACNAAPDTLCLDLQYHHNPPHYTHLFGYLCPIGTTHALEQHETKQHLLQSMAFQSAVLTESAQLMPSKQGEVWEPQRLMQQICNTHPGLVGWVFQECPV
jgi:hypothetical protein